MASVSSAVREVRARLLDLQRNLAKEADVIMDGRDIGTNILPNADVKIYLTASVKNKGRPTVQRTDRKRDFLQL